MSLEKREVDDIEHVQPQDIYEAVLLKRMETPTGQIDLDLESTDVNGDPVVIHLVLDEKNNIISTGSNE